MNKTTIADYDKTFIELQHQLELKESQLRQDYYRLKKDVKKNPYLKIAVDEYETHFKKAKEENNKKIKALTVLLHYIENNNNAIKNNDNAIENNDIFDIKREIITIKRKNK